jgi:hypothetical protein
MFSLENPTQPLLMVGEDLPMRPLAARERRRRRGVTVLKKKA